MNTFALAKDSVLPQQTTPAILPGAPWLIAHKSMLGVNQPYKISLNDQDYVLWQNKQGEVFALSNICSHMQAPLADGWICAKRNTIACPFHGLEFNGKGKLYQNQQFSREILSDTLEIIVKGDLIWTYGGYEPKLPIPDLIPRQTKGFQFIGVAGEKTIQANFLSCLKVNYDFNHALTTHRKPFGFNQMEISKYEPNGYYTKLKQKISRTRNSLKDIWRYPVLMTTAKTIVNDFEYSFPNTTSLLTDNSSGSLAQFFILYPEAKNRTKTFILLYVKPNNGFYQFVLPFFRKSMLEAFSLIVEQDSHAVETLYPVAKPKIRLPREEIMYHAEKLYHDW